MLSRIVIILGLFVATSFAQDKVSPNDTAKFLAGVPVRGTTLEWLSGSQAWMDHATEFDKAWQLLDTRQLSKIRAWGPEFLGNAYTDRGPMFYFYSGPDILYAQAFYPNASTYILAGLEPVGDLPNVAPLSPAALAAGLANLRKSLNSVLSFSFFITKDMKVDLRQNQLSGTLPVLYVFLSRAGCKLDSVNLVWLDKAGYVGTSTSATPGVRIQFFGPNGAPQTLYYFSTDLSNEGIRSQPGFLKFCDKQGQGRSLLKAASYLSHLSSFTTAKDFLLNHSSVLIEDDSGIPINQFDSNRWGMRYFGSYPGPIDLFKQHYQADLVAIYQKSNPPPLSFGFGYRWHPSQSSLILATQKVPRSSAADFAQ